MSPSLAPTESPSLTPSASPSLAPYETPSLASTMFPSLAASMHPSQASFSSILLNQATTGPDPDTSHSTSDTISTGKYLRKKDS